MDVRKRLRRYALAFSALLVAGAVGCSTAQPVDKQVDDAGIHAQVKSKLTADRFSNLTNVDVDVVNGIVTLNGVVPNAQVKTEAGREAASVEGVKSVKNLLQVSRAPSR